MGISSVHVLFLNLDVLLMKFLSSFPHLTVCLAFSFSKGISINKCKKKSTNVIFGDILRGMNDDYGT
jgi:hypothetical protein